VPAILSGKSSVVVYLFIIYIYMLFQKEGLIYKCPFLYVTEAE